MTTKTTSPILLLLRDLDVVHVLLGILLQPQIAKLVKQPNMKRKLDKVPRLHPPILRFRQTP